MKIIADQNMPLVEELFDQFGEVYVMPGRDICPDLIADADMLLVRSVTQVDKSLLASSSVKFVGSATAGIDHIDTQYLAKNNIEFAFAPGCNAPAVVQYVLSSISNLTTELQQKTVGIVGCGHVGMRLYQSLQVLGISTRVYDPFLQPKTLPELCAFNDILDCDIISLHTPLTVDGPYPTFHMFNADILDQLKPHSILINSSRGGVVDNQALLAKLSADNNIDVVLDVWENEPTINRDLLELVSIATPHIAGYSDEGKTRGTVMLLEAAQSFYSRAAEVTAADFNLNNSAKFHLQGSKISDYLIASYNVAKDDQNFRDTLASSKLSVAEVFDSLRKNYPQRKEYSSFRVEKGHPLSDQLIALGFGAL